MQLTMAISLQSVAFIEKKLLFVKMFKMVAKNITIISACGLSCRPTQINCRAETSIFKPLNVITFAIRNSKLSALPVWSLKILDFTYFILNKSHHHLQSLNFVCPAAPACAAAAGAAPVLSVAGHQWLSAP
jgi:hypothetical protein